MGRNPSATIGTRSGFSATARLRLQRWFSSLARRSPVSAGGAARIQRRSIYILPTGMGSLLAAVLLLMLLGSLNYQNNLALLLTFLMASVAIVGMLHTWLNLLDLKITASAGPSVYAGQDAVFSFVMENDGKRKRGDLAIRIGEKGTRLVHLDSGAARIVNIRVPARQRGRLTAEGALTETRFPLGLFRAWSYFGTNARVTVYPRPAEKSPKPTQAPAPKSGEQGDLGMGADDFLGPRVYRPGDSLRHLDWKAMARERGLIVKQFGGERAVQIWIDWYRVPSFETEQRLSLLCRQVLDADEQGLSYGLRLPGSGIPVGQGEMHKHRCLECLAEFHHG